MDNSFVPVIVAATAAFAAVVPTHYFIGTGACADGGRKIKLEYHKEFIAALVGNVAGRSSFSDRSRFPEVVNTTGLAASATVIGARCAYWQEISVGNTNRRAVRHHRLLNARLGRKRDDVSPRAPGSKGSLDFTIVAAPRPEDIRVTTPYRTSI